MGLLVVVIAFASLLLLKRRRRTSRNERPPDKDELLRPPGYSLLKRMEDLEEKFLFATGELCGAGVILGLLCSALYPAAEGLARHRFTFSDLRAYSASYVLLTLALMAVVALLGLVHGLTRASRFIDELWSCRLGLRGEQAVAEKLADPEVAKAGYVIFHDVPGDGAWNIDHVVVGPGGIFVPETKTRSRRRATRDQAEHEVLFNGRTLQFPWGDDRDAVHQAERNSSWVRKFVAGFAPKDITVQPVLVVPGWWVEPSGNFPVKAMNAKYLVRYLMSHKRQFALDQLEPVRRRFEERCRDVEF